MNDDRQKLKSTSSHNRMEIHVSRNGFHFVFDHQQSANEGKGIFQKVGEVVLYLCGAWLLWYGIAVYEIRSERPTVTQAVPEVSLS